MKIFSFLLAFVFACSCSFASSINGALVRLNHNANENPRIMVIGSSSVVGVSGTSEYGAGFRTDMQKALNKNYVFVGQYDDPNTAPYCATISVCCFDKFQVFHEGIGGDTTTGVNNRINAALAADMPKPNPSGSLVVIHIGGNDSVSITAQQAADNVAAIVDKIHAFDPTIKIYVQAIHPRPANQSWFQSYRDDLSTMVSTKNASYGNVFLIDVFSLFVANGSYASQWVYSDGVHLTTAGNAITGNKIAADINATNN